LTPDDEIFGTPAPTSGGANARGVARYLTVAGIIFVALMTTLEPDVGFAAPPAARLLFWSLQVSTGLLVLQLVPSRVGPAQPPDLPNASLQKRQFSPLARPVSVAISWL
jgi:hypothetical protein